MKNHFNEMEKFVSLCHRVFIAKAKDGVVQVEAIPREEVASYWPAANEAALVDVKFCGLGIIYSPSVCNDDLRDIAEELVVKAVLSGRKILRGSRRGV